MIVKRIVDKVAIATERGRGGGGPSEGSRNHRRSLTNLGWWRGLRSWCEQSDNGSDTVDKRRRPRRWRRCSSIAGDRRDVRAVQSKGRL